MDFLKKHGEKVLFLVLLVGLAATVFLAMTSSSGTDNITPSSRSGSADINLDTEGVEKLIGHLKGNAPQLEIKSSAFTPDVRVICMNPEDRTLIPVDAKTCPYCGYVQEKRIRDTDKDGIPDHLEAQYGLDPNNPNDVFLDQDGDGFSTIVEYKAGFDPSDSTSHPPLIDYLRLGEVVESSIEFELRGIARLGGKYTLQLYWKYPDEQRGRTEYIHEGSLFGRNNEFKVESYTEKRTLIDGKYVDESSGVIASGSHKLSLNRFGDGRKGKITESTATLMLIMGPAWEEQVRVNETIELDKKSYIIVDINRQTVVIKSDVVDSEAEQAISIQKPSQEELDALKPPEPEMGTEFMEERMFFNPQDF